MISALVSFFAQTYSCNSKRKTHRFASCFLLNGKQKKAIPHSAANRRVLSWAALRSCKLRSRQGVLRDRPWCWWSVRSWTLQPRCPRTSRAPSHGTNGRRCSQCSRWPICLVLVLLSTLLPTTVANLPGCGRVAANTDWTRGWGRWCADVKGCWTWWYARSRVFRGCAGKKRRHSVGSKLPCCGKKGWTFIKRWRFFD